MRIGWAALLVVAVLPVSAQSPIVNAVVERRASSGDVARDVQEVVSRARPSWIAYRVPLRRQTDGSVRAVDTCCGRCRLEPPSDLVVLARVQSGRVGELRSMTVDCDVDAGGMPLVWFDQVSPESSVAWLAALVSTPPSESPRIADAALAAIGHHSGTAASAALVRISQTGPPRHRGTALTWLARQAAAEALPAIDAALQKDPDTEVKKQAVFALSRFPNQEGVPKLIDVARTHANAEVRRQAMFWLGESKDPRAVDFFAQILLK